MTFKRNQRVAELIKVNLSNIIQRDIAGSLPCMATIMHVELSKDLKYAKVKISFYGAEAARKKSFNILKRKIRVLRKQLGKVISLRLNPVLTFEEDLSLDNAFRVNELLTQIKENEESNEGQITGT